MRSKSPYTWLRFSNLKLAQKILIPTVLGFLVVSISLITLLSSSLVQTILDAESDRLENAYGGFQAQLDAQAREALALATSISEQPLAQQALAERDRDTLLNEYLPVYEALDERFDVPQAQFHLAPAQSFLRLHAPERFGDDLSSFRQMVLDTNATGLAYSGVEIGVGGIGVRGVVPVFYQGVQVGSFEIGANITSTLLENMRSAYGGEWHLFVFESATNNTAPEELAGIPRLNDETLIFATTTDQIAPVEAAQYDAVLLSGQALINRLGSGDSSFATYVAPLRNYSGEIVGFVQIDFSRSAVLAEIAQTQTQAVLVGGALTLLVLGALLFIIQRSVRPVRLLTQAAEAITGGDLNVPINVHGSDEIGLLGQAFRTMMRQLSGMISTMEQRIAERTSDLATSAEIAAATNQIREVEDLLNLSVNLIRDRFNFYYVQVYLIDPESNRAVLKDGTGYVGRRLLVKGHSLPLDGRSLVARAVREATPMIVQDTRSNPDFLPNELLPDTRAEMVVPLRSKGGIIGVLDIQHNAPNIFEDAAVRLFQTLADQLATTFENVQLFEDSQRRARELEIVAQVSAEASRTLDTSTLLWTVADLTKKSFNLYHAHIYLLNETGNTLVLTAGAGEIGRQMVAEQRSIPLNRADSLVASAARTRRGVVVNDVTQNPDFLPHPLLPDTKAEMAIPMVVGDTVVGVLDVQANVTDRFTAEDVQVKTTLAAQVAVAVQNARAFEQTERARAEVARVYESSVDLIGTAGFDGYFKSLNPAWESTLGWSTAELLSRPYVEFVHPDDVEPTDREANQQLAAGHKTISFVNRYRTINGDYRWLSWNSTPDPEAQMIYFVARDVTEQYNIQRELAQQNAILNTSRDLISLSDLQGNILYMNPGGAQMLGYDSPGDFGGMRIPDLHLAEDLAKIEKDGIPTAMKTGNWRGETRILHKDGTLIPVDQTIFVIPDAQGNITSIATIMTDITERKQSAEALRQSEERFALAIEGTNDGLWDWNIDTNEVYFSPRWKAQIGYADDEIANSFDEWRHHVHPDDLAPTEAALQAYLEGRTPEYSVEFRFRHKDDSYRWILARAAAVRDAEGKPHRLTGSHTDITERKQSEEQRRYQEAFLRQVLDSLPVRVFWKDSNLNFLGGNKLLAQDIGVASPAALVGKSDRDFFPEEQANAFRADDREVLRSGRDKLNIEEPLTTGDGSTIWLSTSKVVLRDLDGKVTGILGTYQDITERKQAAAENERLAVLLSNLIDSIPDLIFYKNTDGVYLGCNKAFSEFAGKTAAELIGKTDFDLFPQEIAAFFREQDRIMMQERSSRHNEEWVSYPDGRQVLLDTLKTPFMAADRVLGLIGISRDITERKKLEEMQRQAAQVIEGSATMVFRWNAADWAVLVASENVAQLGYTADEFLTGKVPYASIVHPEDIERVAQEVAGFTEKGVDQFQQEYRVLHRDGTVRWTDDRTTIVRDADGKALYYEGVVIDITGRKQAEQEIARRAKELETVAQVGVATTTILDMDHLLQQVVDLTKERFNLYHAHIYLLNAAGDQLELTAGAGEVGRRMAAAKRTIALNHAHSLVAQAARTHEAVVVNNVQRSPNFLPNPLLPETRAELAVPLLIGDQLLGVLDVQANVVDRFTPEDVKVKSTLAAQVAGAIQNARAFKEVTLYANVMNNTPAGLHVYHLEDESSDTSLRLVAANEASAAATGVAPAEVIGKTIGEAFPDLLQTQIPQIYANIARGGAVVDLGEVPYQGEYYAVKAFPLLDNNMGVSFDNITERKLAEAEQQALARASFALSQSVDEQDILSALVSTVGDPTMALGTLIYTIRGEPGTADIVAVQTGAGQPLPLDMLPTTRVNSMEFPIIDFVADNPEILVVEDTYNDPRVVGDVKVAIDQLNIRSLIAIPLHAAEQWQGIVSLNWAEPRQFPPMLLELLTALQAAAAAVVASRRAYLAEEEARRESERRATELVTVARVSTATTTILEVNELLQSVVDLTKQSFQLYHAHIYLVDEETHALVLAAGAGEVGTVMKESGHKIPVNRERSLVARAARTHQPVRINDVTLEDGFLPNPLLPETKAELAVPMIVGDELIGVLDVQASQSGRFQDADALIMTTLAGQVAIALRNARAFEQEHATVQRLRDLDRLKQQFLANMSHELRTPLNSIIGYSEVLLDGVDGDLTDDASEDVRAIHESGKHLLAIINDILDLAKIEAGQMRLECKPVTLDDFLAEVLRGNQILVKDKAVTLNLIREHAQPVEVYADPIRLRQIMNNLVGNAVKFTEEGSVNIHFGMHPDNMAWVAIADTGIGIKADDLPVIFEQFRQVDGSSTRRAGGTGLGLTITRHFVRMHGGDIEAQSEYGVGTTMRFTLPLYHVESAR